MEVRRVRFTPPKSLVLTVIATVAMPHGSWHLYSIADLNGNGRIDIGDLFTIANEWLLGVEGL